MVVSDPPNATEGQPAQPTVLQILPMVMIVGTLGMMAFMFFAFRGNPTYLVFGGMMAMATCGTVFATLQTSRNDESKR